jgi:hypothetical protein
VERQSRLLADAERKAEALRWIGDTLIHMDLHGVDDGERVPVAAELGLALQHHDFDAVRRISGRYRNGLRPFHWNLEFPEAFEGRGGFDAIVGNPPFIGGQKITGVLGKPYREFVVNRIAAGQRGSADYSAYFFLRARTLLGPGRCFGLLATNTIAQGDTREVGLDQVTADCTIMRALASCKWPGEANLEVAYVWARKGSWLGPFVLDGVEAIGITSLLTAPGKATGHPYRLGTNQDKSFQGTIVLGMGFVLQPYEAEALVAKDMRNADVLFPYLNGEDLNSRPDQSASRWVINFRDWPLSRAEQYPDCLQIVREKVKPERDENSRKERRERWWQFAEKAPALYSAISGCERVLLCTRVSKYLNFAFVPNGQVYTLDVYVFPTQETSVFAVLQSSVHLAWVLGRPSTHETRMRYTGTENFETFPFPNKGGLTETGELYHVVRAKVMQERQIGLTKLYNAFHGNDSGLQELRDLHVHLDRAVAAAYGWTFDLGHGFHNTKQGVRFTISPEARAKVLDLLLALNHERHAAEQAEAEAASKKPAKRKRKPTAESPLLDHL